MQRNDTRRDQAAQWAARTGDSDFSDWAQFTLWLERDPANALAYDEAVLAVELAANRLRRREGAQVVAFHAAPRAGIAAPAANDEPGFAHARRGWARPALAAACAGLAMLGAWQYAGAETIYMTAPGESRVIALGDGTQIELAGGTRLAVSDRNTRRAELLEGQALFRVRHDTANPFTLIAGEATLVDAGTVFDVTLGTDRLDVEVAEGAVIVNPEAETIRLDPGERASHRKDTWRLASVVPQEVGAWSQGRLIFRDAGLGDVAADLSRATGHAFVVAPGAAPQAVSGSVAVADLKGDPAAIGPLLGLSVIAEQGRWVLAAP